MADDRSTDNRSTDDRGTDDRGTDDRGTDDRGTDDRGTGELWLLASDGDGRCYPVFTTRMRRVGRLDAPYPTNIPHPQLVPLPRGGYLIVTFDGRQYGEKVLGYGGHGDVVILRSTG